MKTNKKIKFKKNIILKFELLLLTLFVLFTVTKSVIVDSHDEVLPNSEITYYLDIKYDGINNYGDSRHWNPKDNYIIDVRSDYIYVEDKLPEGLIFKGFVETEDKTFGAVAQLDNQTVCSGYVLDDTLEEMNYNSDGIATTFHGLHYDEETRKISFKVKNLQAGCKITIGIKAMTPSIKPGERLDFYNTATAKEGPQTVNSNTVHIWMGEEEIETHKVKYEYVGTIPENAPNAPKNREYAVNASVGVANKVDVEGYVFKGWTTEDATLINNTFKMPSHDVTLTGTFEEKSKYHVIYNIEGEIPPNYLVPETKEYYPDSKVNLDVMKEGTIFNDYRFLGWQVDGIEITEENAFTMPAHDVELTGRFEPVTYKVEYKFHESVLPPNSGELLPKTKYYHAGEEVTLESVSPVDGYTFMGWYYNDTFQMPREDITIYGEWREIPGIFEPSIQMELNNPKDYYEIGEDVEYKITITNNESYNLKDVQIKKLNPNMEFLEEHGYSLRTEEIVSIPEIKAKDSFIVYAKYHNDSLKTVTSEVELISATTEENYELDTSKQYIARATFNVLSILELRNLVTNSDTSKIVQYHIIGNDGYDIWLNLNNGESTSIYLTPNTTYTISEVIPQEYTLEKIIYNKIINDEIEESTIKDKSITIDTVLGYDYSLEFHNKFRKKGFFHSNGFVVNEINNDSKNEYTNLYNRIKEDAEFNKNNARILPLEETNIYYYNSNNYNNVLFGGFCWQIVRTTETNGTKLLYNGLPTNNNCANTNPILKSDVFNKDSTMIYSAGYMYNSDSTKYLKSYDAQKILAPVINLKELYAEVFADLDIYYDESLDEDTKEDMLQKANASFDNLSPAENQLYNSESIQELYDETSYIAREIVNKYSEIRDIFQRVRELTVHALNATNATTDWIAIKQELDALYDETDNLMTVITDLANSQNEKLDLWLGVTKEPKILLYDPDRIFSPVENLEELYSNLLTKFDTYYDESTSSEVKEEIKTSIENDYYGNISSVRDKVLSLQRLNELSKEPSTAAEEIINNYWEIVNMFQRVDELTIYALNRGIYSDDWNNIRQELNELFVEINKVKQSSTEIANEQIDRINKDLVPIEEIDPLKTTIKGNTNYINTTNSEIKNTIDSWYKNNLRAYTPYIEDTVWCNDRTFNIVTLNPYNLNFKNNNSLTCNRKLDSFTVEESNGNGDLIYPIGMLTSYEVTLTQNNQGTPYWTLSPSLFKNTLSIHSSTGTGVANSKLGIRPSISLKNEMTYISGDGTVENPYQIYTK